MGTGETEYTDESAKCSVRTRQGLLLKDSVIGKRSHDVPTSLGNNLEKYDTDEMILKCSFKGNVESNHTYSISK